MNKLNKLTKVAFILLSLALTTTMSFANNNVDMQLNIEANENGKLSNLSIYNASSSNSFQLKLKIEGDVDFKSIDFSDHLKQNAITKSKFDKTSKVLDITATSNVDLTKGGVLNIGTLNIEGSEGVTYSIKDTNGITMTNLIYDEIKDDNLEEVGDTSITIGSETELPDGDGEETTPPVEDDNNEDKEEIEKPSKDDIEISQSSDGTKLLIPKTKEALNLIIDKILATDKDAKIISITEDSTYYLYRVKYKNNTRNTSTYDYVDIKVSKEISDKKELPGISVENTDTTPDNNAGNNNNNNVDNNSNENNNNSNTSIDSNEKPTTGDFSSIGYIASIVLCSVTLWILNRKKKKNE